MNQRIENIFNSIPDCYKESVMFCFDCNQVSFYSDKNRCQNCSTEFSPELCECPECKSDSWEPTCELCDETDCLTYLDRGLNELDNDQLETVEKWCQFKNSRFLMFIKEEESIQFEIMAMIVPVIPINMQFYKMVVDVPVWYAETCETMVDVGPRATQKSVKYYYGQLLNQLNTNGNKIK